MASLIPCAKELFKWFLRVIILDLVFECFNHDAYLTFIRISQNSSSFFFPLPLFLLLLPGKHSGIVLGTGDVPMDVMERKVPALTELMF